ncbi:hypothetical protein [Pseudochelatococcus contaminans]|uniref:hypothetical protein n=1 Tax=Pseudochelatococcus contaminans TaxID=1538103 RepID=UPI0016132BEE|nr:hypothetical protein [Pseudochelatococcus contaminans]
MSALRKKRLYDLYMRPHKRASCMRQGFSTNVLPVLGRCHPEQADRTIWQAFNVKRDLLGNHANLARWSSLVTCRPVPMPLTSACFYSFNLLHFFDCIILKYNLHHHQVLTAADGESVCEPSRNQ